MRLTKTVGTLAAISAATAACLAGAHAAVADCGSSLVNCDYNAETYPFPMENRVLGAHFDLLDRNRNGKPDRSALRLYRRLVRRSGYQMPTGARPALGLYMVRVSVPESETDPAAVTDYLEGNLGILVSHEGENGWFSIGMPVNDLGAQSSGRRYGYPKFQSAMSLDDASARGTVPSKPVTFEGKVNGQSVVKMTWAPRDSLRLPQGTKRVTLFRDPFFQRSAPLTGPDMWRTQLTPLAPVPQHQGTDSRAPESTEIDGISGFKPKPGLMHVTFAPDINNWDLDAKNPKQYRLPDIFGKRKLSDLIATDQTVPGGYLHIQQNLFFQQKRLNRHDECVTNPIAPFDAFYQYPPPPLNAPIRDGTHCYRP